MKKKILISTILTSALVGYSSNAFSAKLIPIVGNPKQGESVNVLEYSKGNFQLTNGGWNNGSLYHPTTSDVSLKDLPQRLSGIAQQGVVLAIDPKEMKTILARIKLDKGVRNAFRDILEESGVTLAEPQLDAILDEGLNAKSDAEIKNFAKKLSTGDVKNNLPNPQKNPNQKDSLKNPTDKDLLHKERAELESLGDSVYKISTKIIDEAKAKKTLVAQKIADVNKLRDSKKPEDQAKIKELMAQIYASQEMSAVRNHPMSHEVLKKKIEFVKKAKSSNNKALQEEAKKVLKSLEGADDQTLDGQTFADPSRVAVKDLPQMQKPDTHTTGAILNSSLTASNVLTDRMHNVGGFGSEAGVASGDVFENYGVWMKGNFSTGNQRAFKKEAGYSFDQKGITIGADTGDESLIGAAYSFLSTNAKSKSSSSAKDDINTHILSIYGLYSLAPEMFVSAQGSYGISQVKKTRATGDIANNKAKAKAKGNNFGGRVEFGYIYKINESISLIPTAGIGHNSVTVGKYSEKGTGLNRDVAARTTTRTSAIAGVSVKNVAQADFTQEVHVNIDYALSAKNPATKITLVEGLKPLVTPSEKVSKLYYSVGGSLKVRASDVIDVEGGYDLGLSTKFMSHTGVIKLKLNF